MLRGGATLFEKKIISNHLRIVSTCTIQSLNFANALKLRLLYMYIVHNEGLYNLTHSHILSTQFYLGTLIVHILIEVSKCLV